MNPFYFIKSEYKASKAAIIGLVLLLGLSISLGVSISLLENSLRKGMNKASDEFGVLIGASGSSVQLFLSTVYLQQETLPLIKGNPLASLSQHKDINWYAPLAFGDRYKNHLIVGTSQSFIHKNKADFKLAEGRNFEKLNEAVIGNKVELALNAVFSPIHGQIALPEEDTSHSHEIEYKVVGKMPYTGTPYDNAILVPIESIWNAHDILPTFTDKEEEEHEHSKECDHEEDSTLLGDNILSLPSLPGISAIIVQPTTFASAYKIRGEYNTDFTQAVFSGEVLTGLFALLGDMRVLMEGIAILSQVIAFCAMVFICIFIVVLRKKSIELMETLGAPRSYLFLSMGSSVALILFCGLLCGLFLGFGITVGVSTIISGETGILFPFAIESISVFD